MLDHVPDSPKTYSTGGLAQACGVTVRTVQYYDEKGLLPPSGLTEGGRRVYSEADAAKLRKILLLKSLGLRLADIRSILESDVSATVLRDILVEQDARLVAELEERMQARTRIAAMVESLDATGELPAEIVSSMEDIMQGKQSWRTSELAPMYWRMVATGILVDIVEVGTIAFWVATGNWLPFAVALPFIIVAFILVVRVYRRHTAYLCSHCRTVFVPKAVEWFFARHTPTTRKAACTACGKKDWCAEVSVDRLSERLAQ